MLQQNNPIPLLQVHYRPFIARTDRSAPVLRFGTQGLNFLLLAGSLRIAAQVPAVPHKSPDRARAISMPDTAHPVSRLPMGSSRGNITSPVLMSSKAFRHLNDGSRVFAFSIDT